MRTVQMTIDELTLEEVDRLIATLNTTRSAFIREALRAAIHRYAVTDLEKQHAQGYAQNPVKPDEFDVWATEQAWGAE